MSKLRESEMDIDKIVAEMPKAENPHLWQSELWFGFEGGVKTQCQLLVDQGWRKVPSEEDLDRQLVKLLNRDIPLSTSRELHRWLLEGN